MREMTAVLNLSQREAIQILEWKSEPMGFVMMAKGVDGDEAQWTEIDAEDVENVKDGTYHDIQLWQREGRNAA